MTRELTRCLESAIEQGAFPGAVALVSQHGNMLFHEAFGCAALVPHRRPVQRATIFDVASLTKVVATTTAIMILFEEGRLALSDEACRFVPQFAQQGKSSVTIGHLMTHSSGLPPYVRFWEVLGGGAHIDPTVRDAPSGDETGPAPAQQVFRYIYASRLDHVPGTQTAYSDLGFILLGEVIERVTGIALDDFVHERVFGPLGMTSTFYNRGNVASTYPPEVFAATEFSSQRGGVVCGQVHDENAYFMGGVAGHAGVFSTAHDLALLVQALLDALAGTGHLLSPTTVARFVTRANLVEGSSWAFGWDTPSVPSSSGKLFSELSFGHTGFTGTSIWVDRQRGLVVILLTNRVHPTRGSERISQFRPYFHDLVVSLVADH